MRARRQHFSLIELVVVMAIGLIALGVGTLALRAQLSASRRADQLGRELLNFCARVRAQAMSAGEERKIVLDAENRQLRAAAGREEEEEPEEPATEAERRKPAELKWQLPEGVELALPEGEPAVGAAFEVFRFFPDGAGAGEHELTLKLGELERTVAISKLTGMVQLTEKKQP